MSPNPVSSASSINQSTNQDATPLPSHQPSSQIQTVLPMSHTTGHLRLPSIQDQVIDMPALVENLTELLQKSQESKPAQHKAFIQIEIKTMNAEFQLIDQNQSIYHSKFNFLEEHLINTLEQLLSALARHDPMLSTEILDRANHLLNLQSQFFGYIKAQDNQFLEDDGSLFLLGIINKIKDIAQHLHQSPAEVIDVALNHFPPRDTETDQELKCLDGVLDRLELSEETIKLHLRQLKLLQSQSFLPQLNSQAMDPLHRMTTTMLHMSHATGLDNTIDESFEAHRVKALFLTLGVPENLYHNNNRFAASTLNYSPGSLVYNTQIRFAKALRDSIVADLESPQTREDVQRYEQLLISVTHEHLNDGNFARRLARDSVPADLRSRFENPQSYGLKLVNTQPLSQYLKSQNTQNTMTFEQEYGIWDEHYTQLHGWDFAALNQTFQQQLDQEWHFSSETSLLSRYTYEEIPVRVRPDYVSAALFGQVSHNEQWLALNYMLAMLNGNSTRIAVQHQVRLVVFHLILKGRRPEAAVSHFKFAEYAESLLEAFLNHHREMPVANQNLMQKLKTRLNEMYTASYPYNMVSIGPIFDVYTNFASANTLTLQELTYGIDLPATADILSHKFQQYLKLKPGLQELQRQLTPVIKSLLQDHDTRIPYFLKHIFKESGDRLNSILINIAIKTIQLNNLQHLNQIKTVFEGNNSLLKWFPDLLKSNRLHQSLPRLAYFTCVYGITQSDKDIYISYVLNNLPGLQNLATADSNAHSSIVSLHVKAPNPDDHFFRKVLINSVSWPASHFLSRTSRIADSEYFKTIKDKQNISGFRLAYSALISGKPNAIHQIIEEFLLPQLTQAQKTRDLDFFMEMSRTLKPADKIILGRHRGQLFHFASTQSPEWRKLLMIAIMRALPASAIHPLADLIFLMGQNDLQRTQADSLINITLQEMGISVSALMQSYSKEYVSSADFLSHIIFAATTPHDQSIYPDILSEEDGVREFMVRLIQNNPLHFFEGIQDHNFGTICKHHQIQQAGRFHRFYRFMPEDLKARLRTMAFNIPDELKNSIASGIFNMITETR